MNSTKGINTIRNSMKLFRLGIKFSKEFFVWKLIWVLVKAARTVLVDVLLLKFVLDAITEGKSFYETLGFVLICVSFSFAEMYMNDWVNTYVQPIAKNKIHKAVHQMIFRKICTIDSERFDDSHFYDKYIWTLEKASDQMMLCMENYMKLAASIVSMISIAAIAQGLGLYLYIIYKAIVEKSFTAGTCASVINAVDRLSGYFYQFTFSMLAVQKNGLYAADFFAFLNHESIIEAEKTEGIAV